MAEFISQMNSVNDSALVGLTSGEDLLETQKNNFNDIIYDEKNIKEKNEKLLSPEEVSETEYSLSQAFIGEADIRDFEPVTLSAEETSYYDVIKAVGNNYAKVIGMALGGIEKTIDAVQVVKDIPGRIVTGGLATLAESIDVDEKNELIASFGPVVDEAKKRNITGLGPNFDTKYYNLGMFSVGDVWKAKDITLTMGFLAEVGQAREIRQNEERLYNNTYQGSLARVTGLAKLNIENTFIGNDDLSFSYIPTVALGEVKLISAVGGVSPFAGENILVPNEDDGSWGIAFGGEPRVRQAVWDRTYGFEYTTNEDIEIAAHAQYFSTYKGKGMGGKFVLYWNDKTGSLMVQSTSAIAARFGAEFDFGIYLRNSEFAGTSAATIKTVSKIKEQIENEEYLDAAGTSFVGLGNATSLIAKQIYDAAYAMTDHSGNNFSKSFDSLKIFLGIDEEPPTHEGVVPERPNIIVNQEDERNIEQDSSVNSNVAENNLAEEENVKDVSVLKILENKGSISTIFGGGNFLESNSNNDMALSLYSPITDMFVRNELKAPISDTIDDASNNEGLLDEPWVVDPYIADDGNVSILKMNENDDVYNPVYKIEEGDSLGYISHDLLGGEISEEELLEANPDVTNPDLIFSGDVLNLPDVKFNDVYNPIYKIEEGDTLGYISYDLLGGEISEEELLEANPDITNPDLIFSGDVLNLPDVANDISLLDGIDAENMNFENQSYDENARAGDDWSSEIGDGMSDLIMSDPLSEIFGSDDGFGANIQEENIQTLSSIGIAW